MPDPRNYDMDFCPRSYWGFDELNTHIGACIKGELRRCVAKELAEEWIIDPVISIDGLSEEERSAAGRVHPSFMGGEYLPDLFPSEVEIARVTLQSTTMDVISIRARRTKQRIIYRIVDEYFDNPLFEYLLIQRSSVKPLKLKQLIKIIDNAQERGLDGEARYWNYAYGDADPETLYDFATITSEYYPELAKWYDNANEEWLEEQLEEEQQE